MTGGDTRDKVPGPWGAREVGGHAKMHKYVQKKMEEKGKKKGKERRKKKRRKKQEKNNFLPHYMGPQ